VAVATYLIGYNWQAASYYASTGWQNNDFTANATLLQRLSAELAKPKYLHAGGKNLLKGYPAN
jgi:hypothetical protein